MSPAATTVLDLRDIHAAPPPAFWPPAPGWWVLAAVLLAALVALAVWGYRRYRAYRHKRQIMDEVDQLSAGYTSNNTGFVTEISTLLRRVALRRYPRTRVASLTGSAWLRFLDDTGGEGDFEKGVGRILEVGPYQPHTSEVSAEELLALVRQWVSKNLEATA